MGRTLFESRVRDSHLSEETDAKRQAKEARVRRQRKETARPDQGYVSYTMQYAVTLVEN
jgi:hypothetical protein